MKLMNWSSWRGITILFVFLAFQTLSLECSSSSTFSLRVEEPCWLKNEPEWVIREDQFPIDSAFQKEEPPFVPFSSSSDRFLSNSEEKREEKRQEIEKRIERRMEDEELLGVSLLCEEKIPSQLVMPPEIKALILQAKRLSHTKPEKAETIFKKLLLMEHLHPDSLNCYGEFLEHEKGEIQQAHHFYSQALFVFPKHSKALINLERIGGKVKEMEEKQYQQIERKLNQLKRIPSSKKTSFLHQEREQHYLHVYHTNAIEGSPVTLRETKSILETGKVGMISTSLEISQLFEVISTSEAIQFINREAYQGKEMKKQVDLLDILQIHKKVLSRVDPEEGGKYRNHQVVIADHIPPHSNDVPFLMTKLDRWFNSPETKKMHIIERAALAHYHLVWIHPFSDGNGRTARMLMNLMLMREGYPPALIKKEDRTEYYQFLKDADPLHGGDHRPFLHFISNIVERSIDEYHLAIQQLLNHPDSSFLQLDENT